jgi:hypothetical protein
MTEADNHDADDYTVEGETERAREALLTARNALQNLGLLLEGGQSAAVDDVLDYVQSAIHEFEETIG